MRIFKILLFVLSIGKLSYAQYSTKSGILFAKEYSKETSLYRAKSYVINEVFGKTIKPIKFEISALAAASSGELTTLVYTCDDLKKSGLVLGFYGENWNEQGVVYTGYSFKQLNASTAIDMLNKIDSITTVYEKYTISKKGTNNVYFQYEDITFLFYSANSQLTLRVFWNGFDSEWTWSEVSKTQKRLLKKLDL
jgi:hypothetical protein